MPLTDDHKKDQAAVAQACLVYYRDQGDNFLAAFLLCHKMKHEYFTIHLRISESQHNDATCIHHEQKNSNCNFWHRKSK